jgi:hypothetical protein
MTVLPAAAPGLLFPASARTEVSPAHSLGLYGWKGIAKVSAFSRQADAVLANAQRAVFSDFSCCLAPPSNLSDPVRVGQASLPDWAVDLARSLSEADFELSREEPAGMLSGAPKGEDHAIKRAHFLLSPGSVAIDDEVLRRTQRRTVPAAAGGGEADQPT